jgi:sugar-specific transcriptional regulator TrmB
MEQTKMVLNNWKEVIDMFEKIIEKSKGNNASEQIKKEIKKHLKEKTQNP